MEKGYQNDWQSCACGRPNPVQAAHRSKDGETRVRQALGMP
jgi:hypothetical protein